MVRVFIDGSLIEAVADDERFVTTRAYPSPEHGAARRSLPTLTCALIASVPGRCGRTRSDPGDRSPRHPSARSAHRNAALRARSRSEGSAATGRVVATLAPLVGNRSLSFIQLRTRARSPV